MKRLLCMVMLATTGIFAISGCANIIPQYEGDYVDGQRHGHGTMVWPDGKRYEGDWVDGKEHGHGTYVWANGNHYEGDYVDGQKHGHGTYVWANGDRYEGDFVEGTLQGRGIGVWGNGKRYEGDWVDGKEHGHGTMVMPDGARYEGDWANGKMHGHGTMAWPNGALYDGAWVNGNRTGHGTFVTADGDRYEGDFIDGNVNTSDGIYKSTSDLGAGHFLYYPLGWMPYELLIKNNHATDYPINELPMYGNRDKTAEQKRADEKYIETMTKDGSSRVDAANTVAKVAWNSYYAGNKSTAIKRFNQAWLLDPENQLALWGFAAISFDRNQVDEALEYFQMAFDTGLENAKLQQDYERVLKMIEH
jgi:hypothetical protein